MSSPSPQVDATRPVVKTDHALDFNNIVRSVRKRPELLIATWLSIVVLSVFWTLGTPKTYRAESMLRMDPTPPRPLGGRVEVVDQSGGAFWSRREFYQTEARVLRSMRLATSVVRALGLNADPGFLQVSASKRGSFKPVAVEAAARVLIGRITVEPVKESSLALVQYEDTDAARCSRVLNALVRTYLSQNLETTSALSASASEWLNGQLANLKVDLEKSEVALKDFREKNDILSVSLEDSHNITASQLEQIAKDLLALEARRSELQARSNELAKYDPNDPMGAGASELLQSAVLNEMRGTFVQQSQHLEELLASYGDENPKVLSARAGLKRLEASIRHEATNIRDAAAGDLRRVNSQISELKAKDATIRKEAHELQALEIPYNQLVRTKTQNEKLYGLVLERARETDLTRMVNINNIRVIDEALEPPSPFKPNPPVNIGGGVLVGLMLGLGVTLVRDLLDRTIKTPADVEERLGLACLGLVPEIPRRQERSRSRRNKRSVISPDDNPDLIVAIRPESSVAEALRAIRTNLMFMSPDRPYRAISVTSALPSEGKTTFACALAIVLAQNGLRVLLVDTDLRRPRIHRSFRIPNDVGVTLACTGQASLDECIRSTDIPNLSVMTSGPIPPNPAEMLQSERFAELITQLRDRFDRVVFDSPPTLPVTDGAVLARVLDGVVLVARAFKTDRNAAAMAVRSLLDVKAHIVGVVINAVNLSRRDYKEYYYYYRREGYYRSGEEEVLTTAAALPAADRPKPEQPSAEDA
jgi:capsular exopolysaccharide synthesis family protein